VCPQIPQIEIKTAPLSANDVVQKGIEFNNPAKF
jgi:hypothetical protein